MEKSTQEFIKKIKLNTYIYTVTFIFLSVFYGMTHSMGTEPLMFILAAFAFYALGRQVSLLAELEAGREVNTKPRAPAWVRGLTYFIVLLLVFLVMFS